MPNLILIIDFGSQYTQLIARRVRESGVYSEVRSNKINKKEILELNPSGVILSGGPDSITSRKKYQLSKNILDSKIPILGICYGMQLITDFFKGKVQVSKKKEFGHSVFEISKISKLFYGLKKGQDFNVWMSHSDKVIRLPVGFKSLGSSSNTKLAAMYNSEKKYIVYNFIQKSLILLMEKK